MKKLSYLKENKDLQEKIIIGFFLAIAVILYNFVWLNRSFTMSEFWSENRIDLIESGKFPYRDFYYFMPPLTIIESFVLWKLSFGYLIIYRIYFLIQRVLIIELVYALMLRRIKPVYAAIGGFITALFASANVYDLVGDYNQTVQLMIVILIFMVLKYVDVIDDIASKRKWAFVIGILGGCMFFYKQTVGVACGIAFGVLLILLAALRIEKNFFQSCIFIGIGAAVPIGITCIILQANHALSDFIYQCFMDSSSKGGLYEILVGKIMRIFTEKTSIFVALLCAIAAYILIEQYPEKKNQRNLISGLLCMVLSVHLFMNYCGDTLINGFARAWARGFILLFVIQIVLMLRFPLNSLRGVLINAIPLLALVAILVINPLDITVSFYTNTSGMFNLLADVGTLLFLSLILWILYHVYDSYRNNKEYDIQGLVVAFGGIAAGYTTILANGGAGPSTISTFITIPAVLFVMSAQNKTTVISQETLPADADKAMQHMKFPYETVLQIALPIVLCITLSQKLVCPYAWWGCTVSSFWEHTETSNQKILKGFKFSPLEIEKYDRLTELIDYYTDDDSVIWGFPYVQIYNQFLGNFNMAGFVPILFYDVCADDFASEEVAYLSDEEPDIIVWHDIPNCVEVHESVYRNNTQLGQRKIISWFNDVKDTDYELIGQVDDIFVYKKIDDTKVTKTYILDEDADNLTSHVYDE